jgi:hypothetical protein
MDVCCLHIERQSKHGALSGSKWEVAAQGHWMMHLHHAVVGTSCETVLSLMFLERYQAYHASAMDAGLGQNGT